MSEPKPFASLSSGLLARKGAARPAMRPQGFTPTNSGLEDLGWNDMGSDPSQPEGDADDQVVEHPRANHHRSGLSPVQSPVHSQQAELVDRLNESDEDFDEEFDETAEPYEPETGSGSFNGFASPSFDEDEDGEEAAPEPEFRVQMKTPKRPLDLGPGPEALEEALDLGTASDAFEEPLELDEPFVVAPQLAPVMVAAPVPVLVVAVSAKAKAAFTLRLDPDRHLKLRLACAVRGRSAQQLVTDALDAFLLGMPELDDMAEKAKKRG